ncbi:MAG: SUMF1/EgtB/PvdO family nonheme iron enzyme, partial [Planctomycetaceae bacterium]|nr:SUMF1/EgtB/PvdO family nonheme iron enzyme [Planctomycetaceae bacterium]
ARAGTETPFYYGDYNADFSNFANLAGGEVRRTYTTWEHGSTIHERRWYAENSLFPLRDDRFSDKWIVGDYVKQYEPNQWRLYDMIGNVWEWTKAENENQAEARGGSWKDRPKVTGASTRVYYNQWQKVINVGFRPVIIE